MMLGALCLSRASASVANCLWLHIVLLCQGMLSELHGSLAMCWGFLKFGIAIVVAVDIAILVVMCITISDRSGEVAGPPEELNADLSCSYLDTLGSDCQLAVWDTVL